MKPIHLAFNKFRKLSGKQVVGFIMVAMGFAIMASPVLPNSITAYIRDVLQIPLFLYAGTLIVCGMATMTMGAVNTTLDFILTLPFLLWCAFALGNAIRLQGSFTDVVSFIGLYVLSLKVTGDA